MPQFRAEIDGLTLHKNRAKIESLYPAPEGLAHPDWSGIRQWYALDRDLILFEGEAPDDLVTILLAMAQGHPIP